MIPGAETRFDIGTHQPVDDSAALLCADCRAGTVNEAAVEMAVGVPIPEAGEERDACSIGA